MADYQLAYIWGVGLDKYIPEAAYITLSTAWPLHVFDVTWNYDHAMAYICFLKKTEKQLAEGI